MHTHMVNYTVIGLVAAKVAYMCNAPSVLKKCVEWPGHRGRNHKERRTWLFSEGQHERRGRRQEHEPAREVPRRCSSRFQLRLSGPRRDPRHGPASTGVLRAAKEHICSVESQRRGACTTAAELQAAGRVSRCSVQERERSSAVLDGRPPATAAVHLHSPANEADFGPKGVISRHALLYAKGNVPALSAASMDLCCWHVVSVSFSTCWHLSSSRRLRM